MRKFRVGDTVVVTTGKDSGKEARFFTILWLVQKVFKEDKVIVQGINVVKKSQKPNQQLGVAGGIVEFEKQ